MQGEFIPCLSRVLAVTVDEDILFSSSFLHFIIDLCATIAFGL